MSALEVEVVGGPRDGEVWALPPGTREWRVPMLDPLENLAYTCEGATEPSRPLRMRVLLVPIRRRRRDGKLIADWYAGRVVDG